MIAPDEGAAAKSGCRVLGGIGPSLPQHRVSPSLSARGLLGPGALVGNAGERQVRLDTASDWFNAGAPGDDAFDMAALQQLVVVGDGLPGTDR